MKQLQDNPNWDYLIPKKLDEFGFKSSVFKGILEKYSEKHRFYHNCNHISSLLDLLRDRSLLDNDILFLTTIFHDIVYNPRSNTNEKDSAHYFQNLWSGNPQIGDEVFQNILDTKDHIASSDSSEIFCQLDLDILSQPLDKLIEFENKIFKEFQFYDWKDYKEGRIKVLKDLQTQNKNLELKSLIQYIEARRPNIGIYPGSFNPFHKGHLNILEKAERIFDKIIIARGINPDKQKATLEPLPKAIEYRQQDTYSTLLTEYIESLDQSANYTIIRGLRNSTDLQYELTQYRYLQDLSTFPLNVVSIFCDSEYEHISSSAIKKLELFSRSQNYLL